ncbi:hypothetical protein MD484_g590, partial [Candolleomyces efflorescens]
MSTKEFIYQYPAFTRTGLEHKDHTLSVVMSGPQEHLFLNFDYATYTYDNTLYSGAAVTVTSTSSPSSQPTSTAANSNDKNKTSLAGPVAGGVAGGVAIFALFVLALFFIRRRKSRRAEPPPPISLITDNSDPPICTPNAISKHTVIRTHCRDWRLYKYQWQRIQTP